PTTALAGLTVRTVDRARRRRWTVGVGLELRRTLIGAESAAATGSAALPAPALAAAPAADAGVVGVGRRDRRDRDPHRTAHVLDHRAATAATRAPRLGLGDRRLGRQHRRDERALGREHRSPLAPSAPPAPPRLGRTCRRR